MKNLIYFKNFNENSLYNNQSGELIKHKDVIDCIHKGGVIFTKIVKNYSKHEEDKPIRPISIDNDGTVTVEIEENKYEVDLKNIIKLEYE